jgi:hypothetical protein
MPDDRTSPFRLNQSRADLGKTRPQRLKGSLRVLACARAADSSTLLHTAWMWRTFVPLCTPDSMPFVGATPCLVEHYAA